MTFIIVYRFYQAIVLYHFQFNNPAVTIASCTLALLSLEICVNGNRVSGEHLSKRLAAYLTGPGLVSQNNAE